MNNHKVDLTISVSQPRPKQKMASSDEGYASDGHSPTDTWSKLWPYPAHLPSPSPSAKFSPVGPSSSFAPPKKLQRSEASPSTASPPQPFSLPPFNSLKRPRERSICSPELESKHRKLQKENHELRQRLVQSESKVKIAFTNLRAEQDSRELLETRIKDLHTSLDTANSRFLDATEENYALKGEIINIYKHNSLPEARPVGPLDRHLDVQMPPSCAASTASSQRSDHHNLFFDDDPDLEEADAPTQRRNALSATPESFLARALQNLAIQVTPPPDPECERHTSER